MIFLESNICLKKKKILQSSCLRLCVGSLTLRRLSAAYLGFYIRFSLERHERQLDSCFCTGNLMNFKPLLHSHILPFRSALREHKVFVQSVLADAIISKSISPTFNVPVDNLSQNRSTTIFLYYPVFGVTKEPFKNKSYIFLLNWNNKHQHSNSYIHATRESVHPFQTKLHPGTAVR